MRAGSMDLDYLAARLHGRRSRLAEAGRLDELCRLRSLPDLGAALYPTREVQTAVDLQRQLVQDLANEVRELAAQLTDAEARLLEWLLARFQVENLKVLARGFATRLPPEAVERHLLVLPTEWALKSQALATAGSLPQFIALLPPGLWRESLQEAAQSYGERAKPFFLEATLDRGYFRELLARMKRLGNEDREAIEALVFQEVDLFHLRLVSRGKFYYGLAPALLLPLHVEGSGLSRARFIAMLEESDLRAAAERAVGHALDALPPEPKETQETPDVAEVAMLEALAWERYLRLAKAAFRRSPVGLGTVVGYVGIRRVEVANLITLSEGLRAGLGVDALRARLVPRREVEAAHV